MSFLIRVVLGLCLMTSVTWAVPVQDPYNILATADSFLGQAPFADAFKCDDKATYNYDHCDTFCNPRGCTRYCNAASLTHLVTGCTAALATVQTDTTRGQRRIWTVTPAEYTAVHGNYLRAMLAEMNTATMASNPQFSSNRVAHPYDYVRIERASTFTFPLPTGNVEAIRVEMTAYLYDVRYRAYYRLPIAAELGRRIPHVGQLLDFHTREGLGTRLMSVYRR